MLIRSYSTILRTTRVDSGINVTLKNKFRPDKFLYTRQYSTFEITNLTIRVYHTIHEYKNIRDNVMCGCAYVCV